MGELFTATRRLAVQELGKWILRDTFEKAINYELYKEGAQYRIGRCSAITRDGSYVFRIWGRSITYPTPPSNILAFRPIPLWRKEVTYAYVIASSKTFNDGTFLELTLTYNLETSYTWSVRFQPTQGKWKYLNQNGSYVDGTFTYPAQQSGESIHYGLVFHPATGKYIALYVRGQRYDIHELEAYPGKPDWVDTNVFAYGLWLETDAEVYFDFEEIGVAVL